MSLIAAPDGDLWVGTQSGLRRLPSSALNQLSPAFSEAYHLSAGPQDAISCLQFDSGGVLWVGTGKGLYRYEHGTFSSVIPDITIDRIEKASNGHILIMTPHGFVEWDGAAIVEYRDLPAQLGIPADKIYGVFEDRLGARWFSTAAGLARQFSGSFQRYKYPGPQEVYRTYEDPQGNIWVSRPDGLFRVTGTTLEPACPDLKVRCLLADQDGSLWIGTNGQGLSRLKDRLVRMYTSADGLPGDVVMSVLAGSDGKLWVGNNCGGLSSFDGHRFRTYSEKDGLSNSCVLSVVEDRNKDIWVGTYNGGLFRLRDGRFTQFSKAQGLPSDVVRSLFPDRDGSLWVLLPRSITHMGNGPLRTYTKADGVSGASPTNLYRDRQGLNWVATSQGLAYLDAASNRIVPVHGAPDGEFRILGEDMFGGLYGSSSIKGIFRIAKDRFVAVSKQPSEALTMLPQDQDLWFIANGIYRAPADSLPRWERELDLPRDQTLFDRTDGLNSAQCSDTYPNAAITADGKLWVATVQGLAMIDAPRLPRTTHRPSIYMEDVTVGRTSQSAGSDLVLQPGTYHVELRFGAIELRSPEKIHFQYKMDGVDPSWYDGNATNTAVYNSFPKGTHQFHVRACNRDGIWDREGFIYNITQQPFFYETNLFRFAMFATALLLIAAAYQLRLRQVTARINAQLDARVEERTRMARELHDTLLQTIQVSKMVAEHAWVGYRDDTADPRTGALEKLSGWLARALEEARASLQSLRSSATETNDLADALRQAGAECVLDRAITFELSVQGTAKEMHPIIRDEVYRIGYEAIRNACLHSSGNRVEVHLEYAYDLLLRVRDDGKGIDPEVAAKGKPGHFGLKGMEERAARIGGKLVLSSSPVSGTQVGLTVPGRLIFRDKRPFWRKLFSI